MKLFSHINIFRQLSMSFVGLWFVCFAVLPIILMVVISFMTPSTNGLVVWHFTVNNYVQLANDIFFRIFIHSFEFSLSCTIITLLLAYPAAYFISESNKRIKPLLLMFIIMPFWTSSLIRTYAMMALVKTKGIINTVLLALGIIHQPLLMLYTNMAMLIGFSYNLLPFMILPLYSNFEKLDYRIFDAARDLGASRWRIFRSITLPLTLPGIIVGVLFVFLPAMTLFYIPDLLGGARGILLGNLVKEQFLVMNDWPGGAATSTVLTCVLLIMLACYRSRVGRSQLQELV